MGRLVVVSNRVPALTADAAEIEAEGGLVTALRTALERQTGLWFGWSGKTAPKTAGKTPRRVRAGPIELATMDLSEDDHRLYYNGFANRTLWPLLHSFPERVVVQRETYRAYRRVNTQFAEALCTLLEPEDLVWVHDFHLIPLGEELANAGWRGKTGLFLHVPFPSANIFGIVPWSRSILESLLYYDVVGVQATRSLRDLRDTLQQDLQGSVVGDSFIYSGRQVRLGAYPVGIDPEAFRNWAVEAGSVSGAGRVQRLPSGQKTVLGVDRLDYTKGVPHRLRAFESLLRHYPSVRGRVSLVQVSSPSRTQVPEYLEEKRQVERLVGEINGQYSGRDWIPIRYLYRSYSQRDIAQLYRDVDVCLVTPLRDGMNLVAKEFVASQTDDPGVLVLSKFTGAAESLQDALVVNPYDTDGTARAIHEGLTMGKAARQQRWQALADRVWTQTAGKWCDDFQADLAGS